MFKKLNRLNSEYEYLSNLSDHYSKEEDWEFYHETRRRMTKVSVKIAMEKVRINNNIRASKETLIIRL